MLVDVDGTYGLTPGTAGTSLNTKDYGTNGLRWQKKWLTDRDHSLAGQKSPSVYKCLSNL